MAGASLDRLIFIVILAAGAVWACLNLFGSLIYELEQTRLKKKGQAHPNSRALRARPTVCVIIEAKNSVGLEQTLAAIAQNAYRNCEIVVMTDNKDAQIKKLIKRFREKYPSKKIRLASAPTNNVPKKTNGEFILRLKSGQMPAKQAIHQAVRTFALSPNLNTLVARQSIQADYALASLQKQFKGSLANIFAKFRSVLGKLAVNDCVMYRSCANEHGKIMYASDIVIWNYETGKTSHRRSARYLRLLGYALAFSAVSYFIFIALFHSYPDLIIISWATVIFMLSFGVWADEQIPTLRKIRLVLLTPMVSLLFYITSPIKIFTN